MKLIKKATIIDGNSKYNNTVQDILLENGKIVAIEKNIEHENAKVVSYPNLHVSVGFTDLKANFGEPGFEENETFESGSKAAIAGGFANVCLISETQLHFQAKSHIEYIKTNSAKYGIHFFPLGAATINSQGTHMNELYDMFLSGAVAFSDNKKSIQNAQLLSSLMLYANSFGIKIFQFACDDSLSNKTQSHEGVSATSFGFKGQPSIAEEVMIARDIAIARYYNLPLHFTTISSIGSVTLIRNAKHEGLQITCDIAAHQLYFLDSDLKDYDTNMKVIPPFRDELHREALIEGLLDGTIDAICSDHTPLSIEKKAVEFEHAAYGISSIESAFAVSNSALFHKISMANLIAKFTENPMKIINQKYEGIDVGNKVNLTLFDPTFDFVFDANSMHSKSKNSPLNGKNVRGKILEVIFD